MNKEEFVSALPSTPSPGSLPSSEKAPGTEAAFVAVSKGWNKEEKAKLLKAVGKLVGGVLLVPSGVITTILGITSPGAAPMLVPGIGMNMVGLGLIWTGSKEIRDILKVRKTKNN